MLADDFGEPGSQGWYYGYSNWNGSVFTSILNKDGEAYKGVNGLELKADFVHPGADGDHSAAYKWIAAKDGKIKVEGEYTKEPNSADAGADGVTFRIALNGTEEFWAGDQIKTGGITEAQTVTFDKTFEVRAGDTLVFVINPETNNAWDGGRLSVRISDVQEEEPAAEYSVSYAYDQEYPQAVMDTLPSDDQTYADGAEVTATAPSGVSVAGEVNGEPGTWDFQGWDAETKTVQAADVTFTATRTNNTVLKDDFSDTQGKNGWYYGMCD